jgi:hypothetical protein
VPQGDFINISQIIRHLQLVFCGEAGEPSSLYHAASAVIPTMQPAQVPGLLPYISLAVISGEKQFITGRCSKSRDFAKEMPGQHEPQLYPLASLAAHQQERGVGRLRLLYNTKISE